MGLIADIGMLATAWFLSSLAMKHVTPQVLKIVEVEKKDAWLLQAVVMMTVWAGIGTVYTIWIEPLLI